DDGLNAPCDHWKRWAGDEAFPIWFDADMNEWHLIHSSGQGFGMLIINFCPTCGRRMPKSIRERHFATPDPTEVAPAEAVALQAGDLAGLRERLGEPDSSFAIPTAVAHSESSEYWPVRQVVYRHPWRTVDLVAQEGADGKLRFYFPPRHIGKPPSLA